MRSGVIWTNRSFENGIGVAKKPLDSVKAKRAMIETGHKRMGCFLRRRPEISSDAYHSTDPCILFPDEVASSGVPNMCLPITFKKNCYNNKAMSSLC